MIARADHGALEADAATDRRKIKHLRTTKQLVPVKIADRLGTHDSTAHRVRQRRLAL